MSTVHKHHIHLGKIFSNGEDLIYEIEDFCFTEGGTLEGKSFNTVLVSVRKLNEKGMWEKIEKKEITLEELKPIPPDRPEYSRIIAYNLNSENENSIARVRYSY